MAKLIQARVLCAFACGEIKIPVGSVVEAKKGDILALKLTGNVDDEPAAVEYALSQGGKVIPLTSDDVAENSDVQQAVAEAQAQQQAEKTDGESVDAGAEQT